MRNTILQGDCLERLKQIPAGSVQTCVTSPPYYGLRDYGVSGQIGLEESPAAFVSKMVEVFREVWRVLRDDGTCWINLGDSYARGRSGRDDSGTNGKFAGPRLQPKDRPIPAGFKEKDLLMMPARVAMALQDDGWILRSDIIWHKPTAMPESVTDRPTTAHEHIFLLAKQERYYYDADAIRDPLKPKTLTTYGIKHRPQGNDALGLVKSDNWGSTVVERKPKLDASGEHAGANKRTVWTVASQPFADAHFATFPPKLIEPCILAGSAPRVCEHCGAPWERITGPASGGSIGKAWNDHQNDWTKGNRANNLAKGRDKYRPGPTLGWQPTCQCENTTGSGKSMVLDPFMGAGTTALVSLQHGRDYLGIELNPDYIKLAEKRIATVQPQLWTGEEVS